MPKVDHQLNSAQHTTVVDVGPDGTNLPQNDTVLLGFWCSLGISIMYVSTGIILFILIRYSKMLEEQGLLKYDSTGIVMMTELTKIIACVVLQYVENGECFLYNITFGKNRWNLLRMSVVYIVPAFLYAIANNMLYLNLCYFDPVTVQMFMQTRVLFTGFFFMIFLKRFLSLRQWMALMMLTVALFVKYTSPAAVTNIDSRIFFIFLQSFSSSLAGVYNEFVFKRDAAVSIHMQNLFLYLYSALFNIFFGIIISPQDYLRGKFIGNVHVIVCLIILTSALNGLTTALILKFINVILKTFASAVETILLALVAAVTLGEPLRVHDLLAGTLVMFSIVIYYTKGVGSATVIKLK